MNCRGSPTGLRYFDIWFVSSRTFKCDFAQAKHSFCRAANIFFSKISSFASEETVIEFLKTKCLPILLYDLEVFGVNGVIVIVKRESVKLVKTNHIILNLLNLHTAQHLNICRQHT